MEHATCPQDWAKEVLPAVPSSSPVGFLNHVHTCKQLLYGGFTPLNYTVLSKSSVSLWDQDWCKVRTSCKRLDDGPLEWVVMERMKQMDKFKDRKRGSRMGLRVLAALYSVQTCSSIAPDVDVREDKTIHHQWWGLGVIHRSGVNKARKVDKVVQKLFRVKKRWLSLKN